MGETAGHEPAAEATPRSDDLELDLPFLSALPWLAGLSCAELAQVAAHGRRLDLEAGEMIAGESQPADVFYVVRRGRVRLFKTSRSGKEQVLFILGPGATFNEEVIVDGGPPLASAQSLDAGTRLYALPVPFFSQLIAGNAVAATQVARILADRLRALAGLVEDLSFKDTAERVIKLLLEESMGTEMVLLTKQEMASRVGAAREVVSRALHDLEQAGLIRRRHDGIIYVLSRALREYAAQSRH